MGNLTACPDVVIWAIDLKKGMELKPWATVHRTTRHHSRASHGAAPRRGGHPASPRRTARRDQGQRVWVPSPDMPALVIIIDEYAELADDAPDAIELRRFIARLGRAVAVTLVAATQRPTQKAMGQGAVRSQMDIRICFRVRERKDVDLDPRPGHAQRRMARPHPQRPRQVPRLRTRAHHPQTRPCLPRHRPGRQRDRRALRRQAVPSWTKYRDARSARDRRARDAVDRADDGRPGRPEPARPAVPPEGTATAEDALWFALCMAPEEGTEVGELMSRHRNEPPHPVPAPSPARQGRPRGPGQPGPLARGHHRGASL